MHQDGKHVFQTSIGLGSMMMESAASPTASPSKTKSSSSYEEESPPHHESRNFHRRNTIVRANGRKRYPEPPLYRKTCLRRGEDGDEDMEQHPLTPPTRTKSVAPRFAEI